VIEAVTDPLHGAAPAEIPLPRAPLVRVLSQVRFTEVLAITRKDFVAGFHEAIRGDYPLLKREEQNAVEVGPGDTINLSSEQVWRFYDEKETWRISLGVGFVSLETWSYTSRADFVARLARVVEAIEAEIAPAFITRLGMRYIDQVSGQPFEDLKALVRTEVLGVSSSALARGLQTTLSEAVCTTAEGNLIARWGVLPAAKSHDLAMMPPIGETSWFLDLDAYRAFGQTSQRFRRQEIEELASALAARVYTVFRWAVTEKFLRAYGAEL